MEMPVTVHRCDIDSMRTESVEGHSSIDVQTWFKSIIHSPTNLAKLKLVHQYQVLRQFQWWE